MNKRSISCHVCPTVVTVFSFICNLPVWRLQWPVLPTSYCMFCQLCLHSSPLDLDSWNKSLSLFWTSNDMSEHYVFFKMVFTLCICGNPFGIIDLQKFWKINLQLHVNHKLLYIKQRNGCIIMKMGFRMFSLGKKMDFLTMLASSPI